MMTVTEAAAILGVTERAIRYRLDRGLLKGERVGKWIWLIPHDEVERARLDAPKRGPKRTPAAAPGPEAPS